MIPWGYVLLQFLLAVFKSVNTVLKVVLGFSLHSGRVSSKARSFSDFKHSAHRLKVVCRAFPVSVMSPKRRSFVLRHMSYENPIQAIAKPKNVTLMTLDQKYAVFAVIRGPEFNIYNLNRTMSVFTTQGRDCHEIITLPIEFLAELANHIRRNESHDKKVAILWSPGRCGSTLIQKIVQMAPKVVSMSETDFITEPLIQKFGFKLAAKIIDAYITIQAKNITGSLIFIKPRSSSIKNAALILKARPDIKHVVMYRDPTANIKSLATLVATLPPTLLGKSLMDDVTIKLLSETSAHRHETFGNKLCHLDKEIAAAIMYYVEYMTEINLNLKRVSHVLKYEDLIADPEEVVAKTLYFLNLESNSNTLKHCLRVIGKDALSNKAKMQPLNPTVSTDVKAIVNVVLKIFNLPRVNDLDCMFQPPSECDRNDRLI